MSLVDYICYDETGKIIRAGTRRKSGSIPNQIDGLKTIIFDEPVDMDASSCLVVDGVIEKIPEAPDRFHSFDYATKTWVSTITHEQEEALQIAKGQSVRLQRNALLSETDYMLNSDILVQNIDEWLLYRQALRDITDQDGFPHSVTWPVKPV